MHPMLQRKYIAFSRLNNIPRRTRYNGKYWVFRVRLIFYLSLMVYFAFTPVIRYSIVTPVEQVWPYDVFLWEAVYTKATTFMSWVNDITRIRYKIVFFKQQYSETWKCLFRSYRSIGHIFSETFDRVVN